MARLMVWHRRAGLAAMIGVIGWALSGVLHPIMARIQPRPVPVQAAPDPAPAARGVGLDEVLQRNRIESISDARVVRVAGELYFQVTRPRQALREYFSIDDATPAPQADRLHAERLARQWAGEAFAPVRSARLQEQFDREYSTVNRLLPVWRIEFDRPDDMTVFVDTGSDRLGALVDGRRRLSASLFSTLHRWDWLESQAPMLRLGVLTVMLVAALVATVVGVWMFFHRSGPRRGWGLRRIHRLAGLGVSVAAIALLGSGLYHLLHSGLRGDPAVRLVAEPAAIAPGSLRVGFAEAVDRSGIPAPARVSLAEIEGVVHFRIEPARPAVTGGGGHHGSATAKVATPAVSHVANPTATPEAVPAATHEATRAAAPLAAIPGDGRRAGRHASPSPHEDGASAGAVAASGHHDHGHPPAGSAALHRRAAAPPVYVSARDGSLLREGEARYAAWIASRASGRAPRGEIEPVTRFGGEYGFVYKRLPVQRVALEGADAMVVYVDTASRSVAAAIDTASRLEGWVFSNVHKQDWLVPLIGRDARDALVAAAALGLGGVATLGLLLFARSRGARGRRRSTAWER